MTITIEGKEMSKIFGFSSFKGSYKIESQGKTLLVEGEREKGTVKYKIRDNSFGEADNESFQFI